MCGLAGFWQVGGFPPAEANAVASAMALEIAHRGPDDAGVWTDPDAGIALAHRRLAVVDLSAAGHQPMTSPSGRYVIIFNGEIYNHLELRADMAKAASRPPHVAHSGDNRLWRGHSDTETLLAGFDVWGIRPTIEKTIGMFSIVIWDRQRRELTLVRDRLGEKPLYYGWQGQIFLFASELKAFRAHPSFRPEVDRQALALLTRYDAIPAPYTIYRGFRKLLPGSILTITENKSQTEPQKYWDLRTAVADGESNSFRGSPTEAIQHLETLLRTAVSQQMIADVPLGAFLSGGVDSSTIVALMQSQSNRPVRTFTIGFHETEYNEAEDAKAVARHLGTDHTEMYISPKEAQDVIPKLPSLYSEPFADASQIPTFLVSRLARQHVTVSLSGDGGDELFGGYHRYALGARLHKFTSACPPGLRLKAARILNEISGDILDEYIEKLKMFLPMLPSGHKTAQKLHKLSSIISSKRPAEFYRQLVSHWLPTDNLILFGEESITSPVEHTWQMQTKSFMHQMMAIDMSSYLPDDILAKVDRAAMGVSLETRVPLLNHHVVEFAWKLPVKLKVRIGSAKWPLRKILYNYVPSELIERKKMGFGVPIAAWLRGPLREWAESLLDEHTLRRDGFFEPLVIRKRWSEHLDKKYDWSYHLWSVLIFQAWLHESKITSQPCHNNRTVAV